MKYPPHDPDSCWLRAQLRAAAEELNASEFLDWFENELGPQLNDENRMEFTEEFLTLMGARDTAPRKRKS